VQEAYAAGLAGYRIFERWADTLADMSNGRLNIETYPEGGIVGTFDAFDAAMAGTLDGFISWPQYWPGKHPLAVYVSSFPYGLDMAWMWECWFYNLGGINIARDDYAKFGLYYVAPIQTGPNYAHCVKPLTKMEDWDGLKCRYPGGMIAEIYEKAGASVVILPGGEIYTAMATGVIDLGEYVGHAMNRELGLHEVGKYMIGPGQMHQPVDLQAFIMNANSWNKLPADLQKILIIGSEDLSWSLHRNIMSSDLVAKQWMINEYGNVYMELPAAERAKFRKVAIELWAKWATDANSKAAIESQVLLMDAIGLLDFPGIKDEVESYFPGLLAEGLTGRVVEDFWLGTVVE
jgi:TRAP-type mannitol/chloroaromatic compound transport system substrate-binding protein